MKVKIDKSFQRDIKKVNNKNVNGRIADLIEKLTYTKNIHEIENLKKLNFPRNYFRIRLGVYRIGVIIIEDEIHLIRFLHRKEIYRYFPK